jgi:hypothetical protein
MQQPGAGKIKSASTERHASTKYFCLWKSFRETFPYYAISTAQKKFCQVAKI